ncbi:unnamed protein product [Cyclocybe aegerita]|uniref:Peptidase M24 domain-containing protein n=1 Tax=Cyclocybe aegerita TaxID=1973307 RepID=A0A8S0XXN8_CYCAE|nr:unnamed protein product [Cyclocybe aegerita]
MSPSVCGQATKVQLSTVPAPERSHTRSSRKLVPGILIVAGLTWIFAIRYGQSQVFDVSLPLDSPHYQRLKYHCADVPPISKDEYLTRQTDLAELLHTLGGKAYIAEPGANTQFYANFSNTNWRLSERPLLLLISPTVSKSPAGETRVQPQMTILTPKFEATRAKKLPIPTVDGLPVKYAKWAEEENPYSVALSPYGCSASAPSHARDPEGGIIFVDDNVRKFIDDGLKHARPDTIQVLTAVPAITAMRERKSAAEIKILKCANEATLLAVREVHKQLYPGIRESQARSAVASILGAAGLMNGGCLTLFGENAALPHGSGTDRTLAESDFALFDCTASLHGYWSDVTRTVSLGPSHLSAHQREIWEQVYAAQGVALSVARNGTRTGLVDESVRKMLLGVGYGQYFTHRLGHGIGLEVHEHPYLRGGNNQIIEIGHTFSNEPGIYIEGEGKQFVSMCIVIWRFGSRGKQGIITDSDEDLQVGVRLEDCFYIAADGKAVLLTEGVGGQARAPWLP